jgi:hypothetical protein
MPRVLESNSVQKNIKVTGLAVNAMPITSQKGLIHGRKEKSGWFGQ